MQNMIEDLAARLGSDGGLLIKTAGPMFAPLDGSVGDIDVLSR